MSPYGSQPPPGYLPSSGETVPKKRNTIGIIALVIAIIGAIFAVVPGAAILGWILLPFGFILGLVGLFISGAPKGTAIAAIIVSIIGTIAGFIFFIAVVDTAFTDAFGSPEVAVSQAGDAEGVDNVAAAPLADTGNATAGTRDNPASIGETLTTSDWEVVVNGFTRNATDEVMAENPFNDPPPAGSQYALVNVTATYLGDDSSLADFISAAWVNEAGNVIHSYDYSAVVPNDLEGELYSGASATGNIEIAIPDGESGLVRLDMGFGTKVFVSVG